MSTTTGIEERNTPQSAEGRGPVSIVEGGVAVEMGWGKLLLGASFPDAERLAGALQDEAEGARDIAFQLADPHVVLSFAPQQLFLDPSHTYRLRVADYRPADRDWSGFSVDEAHAGDAPGIDRVLTRRGMVTCEHEHFVRRQNEPPARVVWVARREGDDTVLGTVTGVDHVVAADAEDGGSSLWCLAVDPECPIAGVGEALVRKLCEEHFARGRDYVDLTVMHDNAAAIALYTRLGFTRVREFTVKRRNPINEPLFVAPMPRLNPYAEIIVEEARRRGIGVAVLDAELPLLELEFGGRTVRCRESLSELTPATAVMVCDDKRLTRSLLSGAGLAVPDQRVADGSEADRRFLERYGQIVVKPARGEQGRGIAVGITEPDELLAAIDRARVECRQVLLEEMVDGHDLRIIVIGDEVVAAAIRKPPTVVGDGEQPIRKLIARVDRRRRAATGGESRVPIDAETERALRGQGLGLDDVLERGREVEVRRTANLHTGGTIHDVTDELSPTLAEVARQAARVLHIPVLGLDLMVSSPSSDDYRILEANERPGLANHEPQPTAERFVDLLFPQTARRRSGERR